MLKRPNCLAKESFLKDLIQKRNTKLKVHRTLLITQISGGRIINQFVLLIPAVLSSYISQRKIEKISKIFNKLK